MNKKLWEPVLKIQTMVSNTFNDFHWMLYKSMLVRLQFLVLLFTTVFDDGYHIFV